jgi:integrase
MRGTIQKRGKTYTIIVDLERGPDGKRKQKSKGGFKTKKEAEKALSELIVKIEKGDYFVSDDMTFKEYLEKWLQEYCANNLSYKTNVTYKQIIDTYIVPRLGNIKLDKLKPLDLQSLYNYMQKDLELSGTTALRCHGVINIALKHAVQWQLLNKNVALSVQAPKKSKSEIKVLTAEKTNALLERMHHLTLYLPVLLSVTTGMRRGEVLGLTWDNVNLSSGEITVEKQLQKVDETYEFVTPKTARSRRKITMLKYTIPILKDIKKRQMEYKLLLGSSYDDKNLVCCKTNGEPYDPDYVSRNFLRQMTKIAAELDIPRIRFHDLRHTHATMLLSQNIHPKIVSERLGHSSIGITLDTYSHVLPDMQKEAAEKLNLLMMQSK